MLRASHEVQASDAAMVAGLIRRANSDNRELAMSEAISDGLVISRAGVGG